jgi:hypothetical protein
LAFGVGMQCGTRLESVNPPLTHSVSFHHIGRILTLIKKCFIGSTWICVSVQHCIQKIVRYDSTNQWFTIEHSWWLSWCPSGARRHHERPSRPKTSEPHGKLSRRSFFSMRGCPRQSRSIIFFRTPRTLPIHGPFPTLSAQVSQEKQFRTFSIYS